MAEQGSPAGPEPMLDLRLFRPGSVGATLLLCNRAER